MSERINLVRLHKEIYRRGYALCFGMESLNTVHALVAQQMIPVDRDGLVPEESIIRFGQEVAQELIDSLWNLGLRPANAKAGDAQIEALIGHLNDMRTIAAHKLGVTLP